MPGGGRPVLKEEFVDVAPTILGINPHFSYRAADGDGVTGRRG